ncbi:hypothetical protein [Streptomyces pilosus]|uniref:Uncharacterized protein n=1 Tax=Streptomyces pilosus TaxID=28893 RepID=A0A918F813_9ACTN|nr:hypothetical protein [Streptomyces pilosus]GGR09988.1 hypothetical protein GCM10010280_67160 [Streptomyces pilosus]
MKEEKSDQNAFSTRELITFKLLDQPELWRLRAIERVVISRAMWSEREREIHVKPLEEILLSELDALRNESPLKRPRDRRTIGLTLPISEFPKVPLLDLHMSVAKNPVYRVRLDESAKFQARYLRYLSANINNDNPNPISDDLEDFLTALFYFPTQAYDDLWRAPRTRLLGEEEKVRKHLKSERLLRKVAEGDVYDNWSSLCRASEEAVKRRAFEEHLSGTQNPLIALPYFVREMKKRRKGALTEDEVAKAINSRLNELESFIRNTEAVSRGERQGYPAVAKRVLEAYAAYGYRWMAFANCEVPLDRPFTIEVREERAVYFTVKARDKYKLAVKFPFGEYLGKTAWKMVSFADAETNHVSIRVADTSVRMLRDFEVFDAKGSPDQSAVDEEKRTFELYLRHSSLKRPERIWIKCHLRLSRVTSCFLWAAMIITAFAVSLLILRGATEEPNSNAEQKYEVYMQGNTGTASPVEVTQRSKPRGLTAADAALILIPTAFVASFLLVKDSSTLVMRVRRVRQAVLVCEFFVMLAVAFSLLANRDVWSSL